MSTEQQPSSYRAPSNGFLDRISADPVRFRWCLIAIGAVALAWVGFIGVMMLHRATPALTVATLPPLPLVAASSADDETPAPAQTHNSWWFSSNQEETAKESAPRLPSRPTATSSSSSAALVNVPLPPQRANVASYDAAPLPPPRPSLVEAVRPPLFEAARPPLVEAPMRPMTSYDRLTAVYDISTHSVLLPDGTRLEAHSGLAEMLDDARYVNEKDRGPTPPHLYELTLRESLFHGVQAMRLNPVGDGPMYERDGLLAHTYMLGANGDSNGCVSFKDYDSFLRAFQRGDVKRLLVVARSTSDSRQFVNVASQH